MPDNELEESFAALLIGDVIAASQRREKDDSQANRRDLVRAIFAAIEGLIWLTREHILQSDDTLEEMSPLARMALREASYQVDSKGQLTEQTRYIALTAMVRLVVEQTKSFAPDLEIDYSGSGWSYFKNAIAIRNRATHPKSTTDLRITDFDLKTMNDGFAWILGTCETVMGCANTALKSYARDLRLLHEKLRDGDPEALALYQLLNDQRE